jgi:hypothetical protein
MDFVATSYVARRCDVPLLVARAGLEELVRDTPVLRGSGWELRLDQSEHRVSGLLSAGWAQRASVEVEVEPWSRSRVMIGLRHRSRAVPWWSGGYFTAAHAAVEVLTDALETWADEPLRTLIAPFRLIRSA